jgi:ABC-type uncharacterized transport system permease subunit
MDNLSPEDAKALKALKADRLGYFLMGLILGACMIGVAGWGFWMYGLRKLWMVIAATGCLFVSGGISIWKSKTEEIRELRDGATHVQNPPSQC